MLVRTRELIDLGYLGFSDLARENTANSLATCMHMQHDLGRSLAIQVEKRFQHHDHEIHRREIIVEQDHLIQRRACDFRSRFLDCESWAMFCVRVGTLCHEKWGGDIHSEYTPASKKFRLTK